MLRLFKIRGFGPFIATAFLNAFSDLGHKIVIQNAIFKHYTALSNAARVAHAPQAQLDHLATTQIILTAVLNAIILLPMIALFVPTGYVADKYPKDRVIKRSAMIGIPLFALVTLAYSQGWFEIAFLLTLALGAQAAFYGPARVSYVRELVGSEQIAAANSYLQGAILLGILGGTAIFAVLFERLFPTGITNIREVLPYMMPLGLAMVGCTILEFSLSLRLQQKRQTVREKRFDYGAYFSLRSTFEDIRVARVNGQTWRSIVGLAMFYAVGQVLLAVYPEYLGNVAHIGDSSIVQGILGVGGVGVVIGGLVAGRLSKNFIETGLIPLGAFGMAVTFLFMPVTTNVYLLFATFLLYGVFSGLFLIPLTSLVQFNAGNDDAGTIIASSSFVQNVMCFVFLVVTVIVSELWHVDSRPLMYGLFVLILLGSFYALYRLPQSFGRYIVSLLLGPRYNMRVEGMKNIPSSGGALLLGNHTNSLDWAMVQIATPRPVHFVMKRDIYNTPILKWLFKFFGMIPISSAASREAIERIKDLLANGEVVALFPEGRLTRNGQLSEFHHGFELAAKESGVPVIPFYLRGLWESAFGFSHRALRKLVRPTFSRDVSITFGDAVHDSVTAPEIKHHVTELSIRAWSTYADRCEPAHVNWIRTAKKKKGKVSVVNFDHSELTHTKLLAAVLAFSGKLGRATSGEQNIGLVVPPSSGAIITTLALLLRGKTLVNLNYTAGEESVRYALEAAHIKTVIVSTTFLERLKGRGMDMSALLEGKNVIALEQFRKKISKLSLLKSLIVGKLLPVWALKLRYAKRVDMNDTAAIVFSSGSEGTPKGVELSHKNLIANVKQMTSILNPVENETMLASLPLFHSFGITVTTMLPLSEGFKIVCQPDPTDALAVGKMIAKHKVTLLLGTSTFLGLYARNPKFQPLMLESVRWVISGAEKLSETVRQSFMQKFGKLIYEGFGTTETAPVASVNVPDDLSTNDWLVQIGHKQGTVGMPVPGTAFKIVDPETMEELPMGEAGLILIGGPQVMKGYLNDPERTANAIYEKDGIRWYKTGDKGKLDEYGFLTIVDRYSRFAKIGGEMLSLTAIETAIRAALPFEEIDIVAVGLPDESKGEKIALLFCGVEHEHTVIREHLVAAGINPLMLPKTIHKVEAVPKLGSGKTDFVMAKRLAMELAEL